jgi:hypothetical protein
MSNNGAFEGEMSPELKNFEEAVRVELPERLDPRLETDLIHQVAAEARTAGAAAPTPEMPARRRGLFVLPARIAVAAGSLVLATAGLAVAGVDLPNSVDSAFKEVGVDLPNQSGSKHAAEPATPAVSQPTEGHVESNGTGGATGKAKSEGKGKGKAPGHGKPHAHHGKAKGATGASNGKSQSAPGHAKTQTQPPGASGKAKGHAPKAAKPPPSSRGSGHQK